MSFKCIGTYPAHLQNILDATRDSRGRMRTTQNCTFCRRLLCIPICVRRVWVPIHQKADLHNRSKTCECTWKIQFFETSIFIDYCPCTISVSRIFKFFEVTSAKMSVTRVTWTTLKNPYIGRILLLLFIFVLDVFVNVIPL